MVTFNVLIYINVWKFNISLKTNSLKWHKVVFQEYYARCFLVPQKQCGLTLKLIILFLFVIFYVSCFHKIYNYSYINAQEHILLWIMALRKSTNTPILRWICCRLFLRETYMYILSSWRNNYIFKNKAGDVYKTKPFMELIQYTKHYHETISMFYFLFKYALLHNQVYFPFDQHRPSLRQKSNSKVSIL